MEAISLPNSKTLPFPNKFVLKSSRKTRKIRTIPPPGVALRIIPPLRSTKPTKKPQFFTQQIKLTSNDANPNSAGKITTAAAADVLRLMDSLSLRVTSDIYTFLIKECTAVRDSEGALKIRAHIKRSIRNPDLSLINRLLLMLVSCGHLETAHQVFDEMPLRDFNSWASMIVAYLEIDEYEDVISLFVEMQNEIFMLKIPSWIVVCVMKVCVLTRNLALGKQVHGQLVKFGAGNDMDLSWSIINFYGRLNCSDDAHFVFDQLFHHNTNIWTERIVNRCREGRFSEAIYDFIEMSREGVDKDGFIFSCVIKVCAKLHDDGKCGGQVHANAIKLGLEIDPFVQCGLIDMYGKCGLLTDAEREFEAICDRRDIPCWNAMLMGYVHDRDCVKAVKFLYKMKEAGIKVEESLIKEVRITCSGCAPARVAVEANQ